MATTQTPAPVTKHDVSSCSTAGLHDLTWAYFGKDQESLDLVVAELNRRGIDPYA